MSGLYSILQEDTANSDRSKVNRGQRDVDTSKPIQAALDAEKKFFENHASYNSKAQYCGTPYLARRLNAVGAEKISMPPFSNA